MAQKIFRCLCILMLFASILAITFIAIYDIYIVISEIKRNKKEHKEQKEIKEFDTRPKIDQLNEVFNEQRE